MSKTGDVVIYQMGLEEMGYYEFEREIFSVISASRKFINVKKNDESSNPFFNFEAEQAVDDHTQLSVGFHIKRGSVVTTDMVGYISKYWLNHKDRLQKLYLVTDSSVQAEAYSFAESLNIVIWSAFSLYKYKFPDRVNKTKFESREANLEEALRTLSPGKPEWSTYQQLSCDIFSHLFCPPLELPRFEHSDVDKRNRRDMIYENSTDHSYWKMLRTIYKADYIVVDAKNYSEPINKNPVIEIAHYLKPHGCGMFAIILTRKGADNAALHAIREQWVSGNKMILVLNDIDLIDMLKMKALGVRPEELIRVKIADFRMSL